MGRGLSTDVDSAAAALRQVLPLQWSSMRLLLWAAFGARTPRDRAHVDVHFHYCKETLHKMVRRRVMLPCPASRSLLLPAPPAPPAAPCCTLSCPPQPLPTLSHPLHPWAREKPAAVYTVSPWPSGSAVRDVSPTQCRHCCVL